MSNTFNIHKDLLIRREDVQLVGKVGEGKYSEVWKANWRKVIVAVKKLSVINATPEAFQLLEKEITTAARLRHPHVVQIYGVCVYSPTELWLVMEYADGGSLFSTLANKSVDISWSTRMRWAKEAAKAVEFLHSMKLLHGDIKSPNFLLVKNEIKITDFGMSQVVQIASTSNSMKRQNSKESIVGGSVRWMAPETTMANPLFSFKSDVFGLGMVFWELATREIPFAKVKEEAQVIVLIKYEKERPAIPVDCPLPLSEIIVQCWDDSPKKRPSLEQILFLLEGEEGIADGLRRSLQLSPNAPKPPLRRYFDINRGELMAVIPKDRIKTLTTAPPYPQKGASPPFSLPPKVEIVSLLPPPHDVRENKHMLVSERYDERLFSRVAEYFHRFYVPHNSQTKVTLDKVDVIFNSALEEQFRTEDARLEIQCKGLDEFTDSSLSPDQQNYLSHLSASQNLVPNCNSNPISAWHGSQQRVLESIYWYGLLNLSKNDPGYYGKGIYFTQEPKYGEFYAEIMKEKANGSFSLLLCWVLLGKPNPVTQVQIGTPIKQGYNSQYALVKQKEAHAGMCADPIDFKSIDGLWSYFPVTGDEEGEGDEIIVARSAQVLPRFVVHYSVSGVTSQPAKPPSSSKIIPSSSPPTQIPPTVPALHFPAHTAPKVFKKSYTTPELISTKSSDLLFPILPQGPPRKTSSPPQPTFLQPSAPPPSSSSSPPSSSSSPPSSSPPPSSSSPRPEQPSPATPPLSSSPPAPSLPLSSTPPSPSRSPISVGAFALYKKFYEKYKNNKLINGDKQLVLQTPPGEDEKVWITINTINQFNAMNLIHHFVVDYCTEDSCPQMTAGPKVSYFWAQDKRDKPVSLPAPMYIKNLRAWILAHLDNTKIFPSTLGGAFAPSFLATVKKIWSRMFRVYAHVYHSHWDKLSPRGAEEFMFSLKYLFHFSREFKLMEMKDLEPMKDVIDKWK